METVICGHPMGSEHIVTEHVLVGTANLLMGCWALPGVLVPRVCYVFHHMHQKTLMAWMLISTKTIMKCRRQEVWVTAGGEGVGGRGGLFCGLGEVGGLY